MADASIPVDLFNPGQVFACIGFLEAADVLLGDAEGGFDWSDSADVRFRLRASGDENPVAVVLAFLASARVLALAPSGSTNDTSKWHVPTVSLETDAPFPFPDPSSPATLPTAFEGEIEPGGPTKRLIVDHWGDETRRDTVKFWGGAGGYPGAALARDAVDLVRVRCREAPDDPFAVAAEQSSSFRLDWRRDYIPIDAGFSLNSHHGQIAAVGFPLVELFAVLGLGNARPTRFAPLDYRYSVIGSAAPTSEAREERALFDPMLMRAALGGAPLPFPRRAFRMRLGWPAKEGQARAITTVTEETG